MQRKQLLIMAFEPHALQNSILRTLPLLLSVAGQKKNPAANLLVIWTTLT